MKKKGFFFKEQDFSNIGLKSIKALFSVALILSSFASFAEPKSALPQVQLLIDVSGSMKKNDPDNLRLPATNILLHLLKDKARLGILTFSSNSSVLLATDKVTSAYEKAFIAKKGLISSQGQYTNINAALIKANSSWRAEGPRFIVLLTDGQVDLGSAEKNNSAKQRLTAELIPALEKNKVQVFTIGLSDAADTKLLTHLAEQTNGIYQSVRKASDLDRSLYNFFTGTINTQDLPITATDEFSREINLDKNVRELTLAFQGNDDQAEVQLYKPNGTLFSSQSGDGPVVKMNRYTFIDIVNPMPGKWVLKGRPQAVERAMIVTNLKLVSTPLTGIYFSGELITLTGSLQENGKPIASPLMLNNTKLEFISKNDSSQFSIPLEFQNDGTFKNIVALDLKPGLSSGFILAHNDGFVRENQFLFQVSELPFQQQVDAANNYIIKLLSSQLDKDSVSIVLKQDDKTLSSPFIAGTDGWLLSLNSFCEASQTSQLNLQATVSALTTTGRLISLVLEKQQVYCPVLPSVIPLIPMLATRPITATVVTKAAIESTEKPVSLKSIIQPVPANKKMSHPKKIDKENQITAFNYLAFAAILLGLSGLLLLIKLLGSYSYNNKIRTLRGK